MIDNIHQEEYSMIICGDGTYDMLWLSPKQRWKERERQRRYFKRYGYNVAEVPFMIGEFMGVKIIDEKQSS